jgi:hypothetical protein
MNSDPRIGFSSNETPPLDRTPMMAQSPRHPSQGVVTEPHRLGGPGSVPMGESWPKDRVYLTHEPHSQSTNAP